MTYRLQHPFTCIVTGPTQSGKSYFIQRLLQHAKELISPPVDKVVWCYSEWQPLYETLSGSVEFHEGLPTDLSQPEVCKLFILDDLADETDSTFSQMFTKKVTTGMQVLFMSLKTYSTGTNTTGPFP